MKRLFAAWLLLLSPWFMPTTAMAVDGCKALLCLAGNWSAIAECVPTVRQLFEDLWHGHPFPTCDMSAGGNSGSFAWASRDNCPKQYLSSSDGESGTTYSCSWVGVINVSVNGADWSSLWFSWSMNGSSDSVTRYSDAAKAQLRGNYNPRWDTDYATWAAAQAASQQAPQNNDGGS